MKEKFREGRVLLWWISLITGVCTGFAVVARAVFPQVEAVWGLVVAYSVPLAAFVIVKEVVRRAGGEYTPRCGEIFVVMWWLIFVSLLVVNFVLDLINVTLWRLVIPAEALVIFIEVVVAYAISEISKNLYQGKKNNREKVK